MASNRHLPHELQAEIVSYLPVQYAAQTSVLSRRFRGIWILQTQFVFELSPENMNQSFNIIDRALLIRVRDPNYPLERVIIRCPLIHTDQIDSFRFENMLVSLDRVNVREIFFEFQDVGDDEIPFHWPLRNNTVQELVFRLSLLPLRVSQYLSLANLRILVLEYVTLHESTSSIFRSTPHLERCSILFVELGIPVLHIDSPSLRILEFIDEAGYTNETINFHLHVRCPMLRVFRYYYQEIARCTLENASNLEIADLDVFIVGPYSRNFHHGILATNLLMQFRHTRGMILTPSILELASNTRFMQLPHFENLTWLDVQLPREMRPSHMRALRCLLTAATEIENLTVQISEGEPYSSRSDDRDQNWDVGIYNIRCITFRGFRGSEDEYRLTRLLLQETEDLQELQIFLRGQLHTIEREEIIVQVVSMPRASRVPHIQFSENP